MLGIELICNCGNRLNYNAIIVYPDKIKITIKPCEFCMDKIETFEAINKLTKNEIKQLRKFAT